MPGIVGMHNHLFYVARPNLNSRHEFDQPVLVTPDDVLRASPVQKLRDSAKGRYGEYLKQATSRCRQRLR